MFPEPPIEGRQVDFEGTTWKVVRVDVDRRPKVAVLELEVSGQGKSPASHHAPRVGRVERL